MAIRKVIVAEPRGFCAGVEMAIKALAWMVRIFDAPVYCYHEVVHNRSVVERFEQLGVIFVDDVSLVPPGAPLMLSAHGSAPEVVEAAKQDNRFMVNAVCPLVTKVHHEAKVRARKGYSIVYVGHLGHDEALGTLAIAPEAMQLIQHADDLDTLDVSDPSRVALLAQTTLAVDDWQGIAEKARKRYPDLWTAERNDLCFATTNRQAALRAIVDKVDAVVVIGSANSSNTNALAQAAKQAGCPNVFRIDGPAELEQYSFPENAVVGLTAGASAPEELVQEVIAALAPSEGIEFAKLSDEDEYFPPPRELRELIENYDASTREELSADAESVLQHLTNATT